MHIYKDVKKLQLHLIFSCSLFLDNHIDSFFSFKFHLSLRWLKFVSPIFIIFLCHTQTQSREENLHANIYVLFGQKTYFEIFWCSHTYIPSIHNKQIYRASFYLESYLSISLCWKVIMLKVLSNCALVDGACNDVFLAWKGHKQIAAAVQTH